MVIISSIKCSKWREGNAMRIKMLGAIIVQINTLNLFSEIMILIKLLLVIKIIIKDIKKK